MRPFVDRVQLHEAVSSQAIPVLEAIAANDHLRSLRRFERDDPPPYVSSTESSEHEDVDLIPRPRGGPMPEELKSIMEHPLTQDERDEISGFMVKLPHPDDLYYAEAHREQYRLDDIRLPEILFRGLNGSRRQGVVVRHLVKRRWEKLGVWNPNWGFAGRKVQPSDNFKKWTWWWQPKGAADDPERRCNNARELVARALQLRQNLRRGEHVPVLPRPHLGQDTTAAQAEAFLISRPWFVFRIEVAEEKMRYERLSVEDKRRYPYSARNQVLKWWQERGDRADAWKWRHESPSPEPEDLTPIKNIKNSPLDVAADMEFTPSEIDEFETIDLPKSEQPEGFWVIEEGDWPPFFPGQMHDVEARIRKSEMERLERLEKARAEGREIPVDPGVKFCIEKHFPGPGPIRLFGSPQAVQHEGSSPEEHEASMELPENASEPQRDVACPPPQKRRRLRQHQSRDGVEEAQDLDQPLLPPPRRSARIAGMKRPAELLPSQTAPNKRPRGRAALKAVASTAQPTSRETRRTKINLVPARPLSKEETKTRLGRGPGRPRKASTPAPAGTRSSRAAGTDAPGMPKRRGRPRKNE